MPASRRILLAALTAGGIITSASAQTPPPTRIRGTVDGLAGDSLSITSRTGEKLSVHLAADTTITAVLPTEIGAIKPGSFIGTAAMPRPDGTQVAIEVHLFPESMRGVGEGHRPYDLMPQSTMTNGTVGDVVGSSERTLKVAYKGGEKTVLVPEGTPIITLEPGSTALLVPGAHVIVFLAKAADGSFNAPRVLVGKDGMALPM
jgi:hypothetical protein